MRRGQRVLVRTLVFVLVFGAGVVAWSEEAKSPYWQIRPSYTKLEEPEGVIETPQAQFREGTVLRDTPGVFRKTGERYTFFADENGGRFVVLENLNLDRIARTLQDNPTVGHWTVTGTITEFQGTNYLLIQRAVISNSIADVPLPAEPTP